MIKNKKLPILAMLLVFFSLVDEAQASADAYLARLAEYRVAMGHDARGAIDHDAAKHAALNAVSLIATGRTVDFGAGGAMNLPGANVPLGQAQMYTIFQTLSMALGRLNNKHTGFAIIERAYQSTKAMHDYYRALKDVPSEAGNYGGTAGVVGSVVFFIERHMGAMGEAEVDVRRFVEENMGFLDADNQAKVVTTFRNFKREQRARVAAGPPPAPEISAGAQVIIDMVREGMQGASDADVFAAAREMGANIPEAPPAPVMSPARADGESMTADQLKSLVETYILNPDFVDFTQIDAKIADVAEQMAHLNILRHFADMDITARNNNRRLDWYSGMMPDFDERLSGEVTAFVARYDHVAWLGRDAAQAEAFHRANLLPGTNAENPAAKQALLIANQRIFALAQYAGDMEKAKLSRRSNYMTIKAAEKRAHEKATAERLNAVAQANADGLFWRDALYLEGKYFTPFRGLSHEVFDGAPADRRQLTILPGLSAQGDVKVFGNYGIKDDGSCYLYSIGLGSRMDVVSGIFKDLIWNVRLKNSDKKVAGGWNSGLVVTKRYLNILKAIFFVPKSLEGIEDERKAGQDLINQAAQERNPGHAAALRAAGEDRIRRAAEPITADQADFPELFERNVGDDAWVYKRAFHNALEGMRRYDAKGLSDDTEIPVVLSKQDAITFISVIQRYLLKFIHNAGPSSGGSRRGYADNLSSGAFTRLAAAKNKFEVHPLQPMDRVEVSVYGGYTTADGRARESRSFRTYVLPSENAFTEGQVLKYGPNKRYIRWHPPAHYDAFSEIDWGLVRAGDECTRLAYLRDHERAEVPHKGGATSDVMYRLAPRPESSKPDAGGSGKAISG